MAVATRIRLLLLGLLLCVSTVAPAEDSSFEVVPGLSAHWYNPDRSGEGLVLEILDEDSAVIYWFTYDEAGSQRWLLDVGSIDGRDIVFPELKVTQGGQFGSSFDPADVETTVVGEAVLSFSDCDSAEWSYSAFDESETLDMTRLTQTMASGCQPINGVPGWPVKDYAGESGSWYDPAHSGDGYTLQWMSRDEAVLIWFTYDENGNQYWITGVGQREGDQIVFPDMNSTSGPSFGSAYEPGQIQVHPWGQLVLDIDCGSGIAAYDSELPRFGEGELELTRLTQLQEPDCPWEPPLFGDLYSISYEEVPLHAPGQPGSMQAQDVANNGKVVSVATYQLGVDLWTWMPGDEVLQAIPGLRHSEPALITPDASLIVAHDRSPYTLDDSGSIPVIWDGESWSELEYISEPKTLLERFSQDGTHSVGTSHMDLGDGSTSRAWSSTQDGGQQILPVGPGIRSARGEAVSNDGRVVVGDQITSDGFRAYRYATRWVDGGQPKVLKDDSGTPLAFPVGCNSDCSVIAGSTLGGEVDPEHPHFGQSWVWVQSVGVHFIDTVDGAADSAGVPVYVVFDVSEDGGMVTGRFIAQQEGGLKPRPFLWTQATGTVSLLEILDASGLGDDDWAEVDHIAISPNGQYLLLTGARHNEATGFRGETRAALLTLSVIAGDSR